MWQWMKRAPTWFPQILRMVACFQKLIGPSKSQVDFTHSLALYLTHTFPLSPFDDDANKMVRNIFIDLENNIHGRSELRVCFVLTKQVLWIRLFRPYLPVHFVHTWRLSICRTWWGQTITKPSESCFGAAVDLRGTNPRLFRDEAHTIPLIYRRFYKLPFPY